MRHSKARLWLIVFFITTLLFVWWQVDFNKIKQRWNPDDFVRITSAYFLHAYHKLSVVARFRILETIIDHLLSLFRVNKAF